MSNQAKEIKAVSATGESQVDGKTIKHMAQIGNSGRWSYLISFTDGQYVVIGEVYDNWKQSTMSSRWGETQGISDLLLAGIISEDEATKARSEAVVNHKKSLQEDLESSIKKTDKLRSELGKLDVACPCCGK